jgi:hypothetical protein
MNASTTKEKAAKLSTKFALTTPCRFVKNAHHRNALLGRCGPWLGLVMLLSVCACASAARAQDSFSSGDGNDDSGGGGFSAAGEFSAGGGPSGGGSETAAGNDLPARSCWMILKQNPLPVAEKDFPRCFPASANLLTLCRTQPPESPSCIALIAQGLPPPQTITYEETLPPTKIINGVKYKKASFLTTQNGKSGYLEGYFNPDTQFYNGSIDLDKPYGHTGVTLDLNKNQDVTRDMHGLKGTIELNTDANHVIRSVTFNISNVVDFQYQPAVLKLVPEPKRLVPASK